MIITKDIIDRLEAEGACSDGLMYLRESQRTVQDACDRYPRWALWACSKGFAHLLTPEQIDACAERDPYGAIWWAYDSLTPERKAWCVEMAPHASFWYVSDRVERKIAAWWRSWRMSRWRGQHKTRGSKKC